MERRDLPRVVRMVVDTPARCTGCAACANACHTGALTLVADQEGFLYPQVDRSRCVQCGACDRACPSLAAYPEAYAFWHQDAAVRQQSSSGGAFTALAEYVLAQGGCVFGAAFDYEHDGQVRHIEIENEEDLAKLRTSKYAASTIGEVYRKVRQRLKEGRQVLFSGTPCQAEGLLSMGVPDRDKLILVDFICHGVPSPRVWREYARIRMENRRLRRVSMRRQNLSSWERYCLELTDATSRQYLSPLDQDPYLQAFLQDIILRPSCYQCPHRRLARRTDFTLADFWGVDQVMSGWNDHQGTSLVLCHSQRAREIMLRLPGRKEAAPLEQALRGNPAMLVSPACPALKRQGFFAAWQQHPDDLLPLLQRYTRTPLLRRTCYAFRRGFAHMLPKEVREYIKQKLH